MKREHLTRKPDRKTIEKRPHPHHEVLEQIGEDRFPIDLWATILANLPLLDAMVDRTVCKSWNKAVCSFTSPDFASLPDKWDNWNRLPEIFPEMHQLEVTDWATIDFALFTKLTNLNVVQRGHYNPYRDCLEWYHQKAFQNFTTLTNLTNLTLGSSPSPP